LDQVNNLIGQLFFSLQNKMNSELIQLLKNLNSKDLKVASRASVQLKQKFLTDDANSRNFILREYLNISPNCIEVMKYIETIEQVK
jgi:hypothetical protein